MPPVVISILLYNSEKYLPDFFSSLAAITYPKKSLVFFILDNASNDSSYEQALQFKKQAENLGVRVELKKNYANQGFAGGHNHGMRFALDEQIPYIYLLNSDAMVEPRFLEEAVAVAEAHREAALVQSLILFHPNRQLINTVGNALHFLGFGYAYGEKDSINLLPRYEHFLETKGYASGAGVLIRTSALKIIGLFDEYLFLYHEDLDLSYRARLANFEIRLASRSIVYHQYEFHRSIQKFYYMERNRFYLLLAHYSWWTLCLILPALLFTELGLFIFALFQGWGGAKLRAYGHLIKPRTWQKILEKKESVARYRRQADRDMAEFMTGVIEFQDLRHPLLLYILNPILNWYWRIVKRFI